MWLIYAAINALGSSLNNLFIKLATGKISSALGALFVYLGGLFTLFLLFPFLGEKIVIEKKGILLALAAGRHLFWLQSPGLGCTNLELQFPLPPLLPLSAL